MAKARIALVQMRSGTEPERNIDAAEAAIRQAARDGAQFVATPEVTNLVQKDTKALFETLQTPEDDIAIKRLSALAGELKIDVLAGSLALKGDDGRAVNRSVLFGPGGQVKAQYDKIHMFDVAIGNGEIWSESTNYAPGDSAVLTEAAGLKLGLTICYDVRFAYLYRALAAGGAVAMTVPAAFTRPTGKAHWEILLRARAIETGSFILAPAQGGTHADGRKTWGRSMAVGPWGDVIGVLDHDEPGILYAEIDTDEALSARQRIPALKGGREFAGP